MQKVKTSKCKLMLISVISVIVVSAALLGIPTNADGASPNQLFACVNPSGNARIVSASEKCPPSEKLVKWNVSGSQDVSGSQGGNLTVFDSAGNTVGPLIDRDAVVLTTAQGRFYAYVGPNGFRNNSGFTLYYTVAGCGETPLIFPSPSYFLFPRLWVADKTGYYAVSDAGGSTQVVSRKDYNMLGQLTGQCSAYNINLQLTPATSVDLTGFTNQFLVK